jgi:hypothetical protein
MVTKNKRNKRDKNKNKLKITDDNHNSKLKDNIHIPITKDDVNNINTETEPIQVKTNDTEEIECFICFDKETNEKLITLSVLKDYYWTTCECNGTIHMFCFQKWIQIRETCPICRNAYISKLEFCKNLTKKIFKFYFVFPCTFMYIIIMFYILSLVYSNKHNIEITYDQ